MSDTIETIAKDLKIGYSKLVIKQEQTKDGVAIAYPMLEVDWQGIAIAILERERQGQPTYHSRPMDDYDNEDS